jgi:hypothetical protein
MTTITHYIGFNQPTDSKLNTLKFRNRIVFQESDYVFEKVAFGMTWVIKAGEVLNKMVEIINGSDFNNQIIIKIYNLDIIECQIPQVIFLKNKIHIQFHYETIDLDNIVMRNGYVSSVAKRSVTELGFNPNVTYSRNEKFIVSTELSLFESLESCLFKLLREIDSSYRR